MTRPGERRIAIFERLATGLTLDKLETILQSANLGELHLIAKTILHAGVNGRVVVGITAQRDNHNKSKQYTYEIVRRGT